MRNGIGLIVISTMLASAPAQAGWSYTQTSRNSGARGAESADMDSRVQIEGGDARMDFESMAPNPILGEGGYMLVRATAPKGYFFVSPGKRTFSKFDPEGFGQMMAAGTTAGAGSGMQMKVSDAKFEKVLEEPGGELQGLSTTHYRYRTTYTMTMVMANMEMATAHEIVEDVWLASGVDLGAIGVGSVLGKMNSSGMPAELGKLSALEREKQAGFPLKRITVDRSEPRSKGMMARMMGGKGETLTTTVEVLELKQIPIPATAFAIPADYTETQMMQPGAQAPDLEAGR